MSVRDEWPTPEDWLSAKKAIDAHREAFMAAGKKLLLDRIGDGINFKDPETVNAVNCLIDAVTLCAEFDEVNAAFVEKFGDEIVTGFGIVPPPPHTN